MQFLEASPNILSYWIYGKQSFKIPNLSGKIEALRSKNVWMKSYFHLCEEWKPSIFHCQCHAAPCSEWRCTFSKWTVSSDKAQREALQPGDSITKLFTYFIAVLFSTTFVLTWVKNFGMWTLYLCHFIFGSLVFFRDRNNNNTLR